MPAPHTRLTPSPAARAGRPAARLALALALAVIAPAACADALRVGGTGTGMGVLQRLGEAYRKLDPQAQVAWVPNLGSGGSIKALAAGAIDVAVTGRSLKPEEAAKGLRAMEMGRTPFVLISAKEGTPGLTLAQVAEIYAGRRSTWPDGQPVRLVLRPASDHDSSLLAAMSPALREALASAMSREGMVTAITDQDSVDAVERLPGGLGTSSLALLTTEGRRARALTLDGVAPTLANLAAGRYPHAKPLLLVQREGAPAAVSRFVAFVQSDAGRRVLAEAGVDLPAARSAR